MNNDRARNLKAAKQNAKSGKVNTRNKSSKIQENQQPSKSKVTSNLQQRCLNIFRDCLWGDEFPEFQQMLQEVKGHLYNRDFTRAFSSETYLRAYALRWSAARSLGYLQVFEDINAYVLERSQSIPKEQPLRVLGIGAGAGAELVSIAGWLNFSRDAEAADGDAVSLEVRLVDIAKWEPISDKLFDATVSMPVISKYASAAAREANAPMVSKDRFSAVCEQADVLEWDGDAVSQKADAVDLVTIMFTLNELYSTSVPKTQRLLKSLTASMAPGSLLLVVDSPGSYSTVSLNGAEKKYPMQWLLDHTLLGSDRENAAWEKVMENESKWFRLPEGLQYPIELENMRYQLHLYKRRSPSSDA